MNSLFVQDPADRLDYELDYSEWLGDDILTSSTWSVSPTGPTLSGQTFNDQVAVCWIAGMTKNADYTLTNRISTDLGRVKERSIRIICREQ